MSRCVWLVVRSVFNTGPLKWSKNWALFFFRVDPCLERNSHLITFLCNCVYGKEIERKYKKKKRKKRGTISQLSFSWCASVPTSGIVFPLLNLCLAKQPPRKSFQEMWRGNKMALYLIYIPLYFKGLSAGSLFRWTCMEPTNYINSSK